MLMTGSVQLKIEYTMHCSMSRDKRLQRSVYQRSSTHSDDLACLVLLLLLVRFTPADPDVFAPADPDVFWVGVPPADPTGVVIRLLTSRSAAGRLSSLMYTLSRVRGDNSLKDNRLQMSNVHAKLRRMRLMFKYLLSEF